MLTQFFYVKMIIKTTTIGLKKLSVNGVFCISEGVVIDESSTCADFHNKFVLRHMPHTQNNYVTGFDGKHYAVSAAKS